MTHFIKDSLDERTWGGMMRTDIALSESDIAVFGIPFDEGVSFRSGAKDAPTAIREITYGMPPTTGNFEDISELKIMDIGDVIGSDITSVFKTVEETVCDIVKQNKFFTMIGGDHSTTIPVLKGINEALEEDFGVIHFDAHFDLCDELCGNKLSHGSTARRALELSNVPDSESIFFIGIRSPEIDELNFINNNKVNVLTAHDIYSHGVDNALRKIITKMSRFNKIYMTIDIDCLDPAYAAGTGTPQIGGLTTRELLSLLEGIIAELPIIGFDVVEVAPKLDTSLTAVFAAKRIITECWGHHYKK